MLSNISAKTGICVQYYSIYDGAVKNLSKCSTTFSIGEHASIGVDGLPAIHECHEGARYLCAPQDMKRATTTLSTTCPEPTEEWQFASISPLRFKLFKQSLIRTDS
uniref:Uncharacterized protein n=1 Tax=Glossina pallidipes TaxID=7398 RepID=A0A1B0ADP0_GLOPL